MITNECKTIREEIDESNPPYQLSIRAAEHLRSCIGCRTFESEQRALQALVASLGTVSAPSDFDFRLRARLAREKSDARNGAGLRSFLKISRPLAVAALVLLVAVAGIVIKNWLRSDRTPLYNAAGKPANVPDAGKGVETKDTATEKQATPDSAATTMAVLGPALPRPLAPRTINNQRLNSVLARKGEATATREFGVTPATVLVSNEGRSVVRVPLDNPSFKISIDDGRGAPRTISLPTFSFGSQKLMAGQSFVPSVSTSKVSKVW